jgi:hypothetical protein
MALAHRVRAQGGQSIAASCHCTRSFVSVVSTPASFTHLFAGDVLLVDALLEELEGQIGPMERAWHLLAIACKHVRSIHLPYLWLHLTITLFH